MRSTNTRPIVGIVAIVAMAASTATMAPAQQPFPNPTVRGPIPFDAPVGDDNTRNRNHPFYSQADWLAPHGYVEEEFFIEGRANRYDVQNVTIADSGHPYRTRMVVRRPANAADFNGTVLLEWQNVTAGYDLDALWSPVRDHIVEEGYAWVGISAQRVGVNALREWNAARYGDLDVTVDGTITDDALSYDIFGQAARSIRSPYGVDPMGGLEVREIIGKGASQSASRLTPFYNAAQPLHEPVIDLLYLAVGGGATRTDSPIPVFRILAETDVIGLVGRGGQVQADTDLHRLWEVAGTSHSGYAGWLNRREVYKRDQGTEAVFPTCDQPAYSRVPLHHVMNAAYGAMVDWIRDGTPPPTAQPLTRAGNEIERDEFGNALGGIRLPEHAVPIALNSGLNSGTAFCRLYGTHQPFDDATISRLYRSHADYLARVRASAEENIAAGYLTPSDAERTLREARRFDFPE